MNIYNRIKRRRLELGLSQQELAEKVNLKTKGAICRIENGKRDLTQSQVIEFAKALNTTPAYLMGWEEDEQALDNAIINMFESLTEDEIAKVTIFIQGLIANRK